MKKKGVVLGILFGFILLFLSGYFCSAFSSSNLGVNNQTNASSIVNYYYGDLFKDSINISLNNEPADTIVKLYNTTKTFGTINLLDFLVSSGLMPNGVHFSCSPQNCGNDYNSSDSGSLTKSLALVTNQNQTIGFRFDSSPVTSINNFSIDISSDASPSCIPQLRIEIPSSDYGYDYVPAKADTSYCSSPNYGCFSASDSSQSISIIAGADYCSILSLNSSAAIEVGANVSGTGSAKFLFTIEDLSCNATVSDSGVASCVINRTIIEPTNLTVCMRQVLGSGYQIPYEIKNPCGYARLQDQNLPRDHAIYLTALKYASPGNFIITSNSSLGERNPDLESKISNYVDVHYGSNCPNGCYVPIKIIPYANQNIIINRLWVNYSLGQSSNKIYSLQKSSPFINMNFTLFNFSNSNLTVPASSGLFNISLKIGNTSILSRQVQVLDLASIISLFPTTLPAGIPIELNTLASGSNITKYRWQFGDNSSIETTIPKVNHKYSNTGSYNLTLYITNSQGEARKSFTIDVISPKDYINVTISADKNKINILKSQINILPAVVKTAIDTKLNLTAVGDKLTSFQLDFNNAGNDTSKYVAIANSLSDINLPDSINTTQNLAGLFVINKNLINSADVSSISGEQYGEDSDSIKNSIYSWFIGNLEVRNTAGTYSAIYTNSSVPILSYINFQLTPKADTSNIFVYIGSSLAEVSGLGDAKATSAGKGYSISGLSGSKSFEIIIPGSIDISNIPVYFFPAKSELSLIGKISNTCNFNGICDRSSGENNSNCSYDCKPWSKIIFGWIIVILIFLILYIIFQEWYKRNYQNSLFPNKDDLYNLINFIDNAEKQGLDRSAIFSKLHEKSWTGEQIEYAYRRYKGKRTGMFEIPIFTIFEKKKVEQELNARKSTPIANPPRPQINFSKPRINANNMNNMRSTQPVFKRPQNKKFPDKK